MASSDYISREDAVEAVEGWGQNDLTEAILEDIKTIPAADVRPVARGVWVKNGWSIRCSICGYDMPFATRNFCPNCGARMEES